MYNIIAFLIIVIFVPAATFIGIKMYKPSSRKIILIFTWILFGCELVRFFYNASFYEKAITPSNELTLTYLSIMCALALFALYNKGKIGKAAKTVFVFTSLTPLVLALFDSSLYTSQFDTYAVLKALYFVETALVITVALLYITITDEKPLKSQLIASSVFIVLYAGLNALARFCFDSGSFTLSWGLSMLVMLALPVCIHFLLVLCSYKKNALSIKKDTDIKG